MSQSVGDHYTKTWQMCSFRWRQRNNDLRPLGKVIENESIYRYTGPMLLWFDIWGRNVHEAASVSRDYFWYKLIRCNLTLSTIWMIHWEYEIWRRPYEPMHDKTNETKEGRALSPFLIPLPQKPKRESYCTAFSFSCFICWLIKVYWLNINLNLWLLWLLKMAAKID